MINFLPRDWKFSFSVLQFWSNHFICDFHLILLPLALLHPASLHVSTKVSLSNSDAVSMLSCLTAAANLDWTVYINSDVSSTTGPAGKPCRHFPDFLLFSYYLKSFWQLCLVVRALASHQCGPGSNPGVDAICGLSLLLVLSFAPRGFSSGTPVFPSLQKPTLPNSFSIWNERTRLNEFIWTPKC